MIPAVFLPLADFLKGWEGCRLVPYRDSAGLWTVGVGHLMDQRAPRFPITQDEADELFEADLLRMADRVDRLLLLDIERHQAHALVSFAFNLGANALAGSTLLKRVNAGYFDQAASEFMRWDKAHVDGAVVVVDGLHKRRTAERAIFESADYSGRP